MMRLDEKSRKIITAETARLLPGAEVFLFGSRVDDNARGGDIDLLVKVPTAVKNHVKLECQLATRLYIKLGGRKVDVLIQDGHSPESVIHQQARLHGIKL